ncbi:DNA-binding LacI/PurR family transcriptional regulator [Frondihabitans sp. PhB188]|uniref:LacI family DNA-binding transcriptional regulator n=1 Tax=Frondihabitans sp. PhB188 TaxID=2485200 RepID=UPI000F460F30|nr:LacI family DNA-binding transcriptional regulator [Frondihabitans sp. PhB188]ROQ39882.1 DNA-binding LacI/PurR family transcriptional regulator [Frondihabitans sp. PhB188]
MTGTRQPTVHDVAAAAGVSRQTVSNVLNTPAIVKPATRERVELAIAALGYRTHASARRLRTRKSSTIGIRLDPVTNGISGSVLDRFLHAVTERADTRGMRILLFTARDPDDEIRQFERLLDGADVDGFLLTSTTYDDPRTEWLIANGADFVTFGRPWGVADVYDDAHRWVDVDGHHGLAEAAREVLELGAQRIAYLGWPPSSGTGDERRRGWRDTMEAAGVDGLDALELACEDSVGLASEAVRALVDSGTAFDGLVCASDTLALGALMVLGSSVPIVGYDNTPVASAVGLASVEQPLEQAAAAALELLLDERPGGDLIGEPGSAGDPRHRLLRPEVVWRR